MIGSVFLNVKDCKRVRHSAVERVISTSPKENTNQYTGISKNVKTKFAYKVSTFSLTGE